MLATELTKLLGIQHPIQCGTMQWLSRAELVEPVAEAREVIKGLAQD